MFDFQRVLVFAPHTDDAELGCGGTIARMVDSGKDVYIVNFSICEESVPEGFRRDVLATEAPLAAGVLGVPESHVLLYRYKVRVFGQFRQSILDNMIELRSRLVPDLVLLPAKGDMHQDHQVVYAEGLRAFWHKSIWGYEGSARDTEFQPNIFVPLSNHYVDLKIEAAAEYKSQEDRPYMAEDFIRSTIRVRGIQANTRYAEAFQIVRMTV